MQLIACLQWVQNANHCILAAHNCSIKNPPRARRRLPVWHLIFHSGACGISARKSWYIPLL